MSILILLMRLRKIQLLTWMLLDSPESNVILVITTVHSMLGLEVQHSILISHSDQRKDLIHQKSYNLEYSTTVTQVDGPIESVQIISRGRIQRFLL